MNHAATGHAAAVLTDYATEHDAIVRTLQYYIEGSRAGRSELMRPGFHADATITGYFGGDLIFAPIQKLFDLIDANGPAPDIEPRFASIDVLETIAVVRLEVDHWSGEVVGPEARMSDLFNLVKTEAGWKISQKLFHLQSP